MGITGLVGAGQTRQCQVDVGEAPTPAVPVVAVTLPAVIPVFQPLVYEGDEGGASETERRRERQVPRVGSREPLRASRRPSPVDRTAWDRVMDERPCPRDRGGKEPLPCRLLEFNEKETGDNWEVPGSSWYCPFVCCASDTTPDLSLRGPTGDDTRRGRRTGTFRTTTESYSHLPYLSVIVTEVDTRKPSSGVGTRGSEVTGGERPAPGVWETAGHDSRDTGGERTSHSSMLFWVSIGWLTSLLLRLLGKRRCLRLPLSLGKLLLRWSPCLHAQARDILILPVLVLLDSKFRPSTRGGRRSPPPEGWTSDTRQKKQKIQTFSRTIKVNTQ